MVVKAPTLRMHIRARPAVTIPVVDDALSLDCQGSGEAIRVSDHYRRTSAHASSNRSAIHGIPWLTFEIYSLANFLPQPSRMDVINSKKAQPEASESRPCPKKVA